MAGQRVASLEILFEMATGQAIADIVKFGGVVDKTMQGAIQAANQADAAMKHVGDLSGPAAQVTRSAAEIRREYNAIERAGEGMVRQIEREIVAFGKSADEMQRMKRELAAVAAESRGMTELAARIRTSQGALEGLGGAARLTRNHTLNLGYQFSDLGIQMAAAAGSSEPLKMAFMALIQQGSQIQGIMAQAGIGFRGLAIYVWGLVAPFAPLIAVLGAAAGGIKLLQNAANDGADMKEYAKSLGLSAKEIRHLTDVTVTFGDTTKAVFQVAGGAIAGAMKTAGSAIWSHIGETVTQVWDVMTEWMAWVGQGAKEAANTLIGSFVGGFNAITKSWSAFPAIMGDLFYSAVNTSIGGINALISATIAGINAVAAQANKVLPAALQIPDLQAPQIAKVQNQFAGAGAKFGQTLTAEIAKAMGTDYVGKVASGLEAARNAIVEQARKNARDRLRDQAEEKGYLDPEAPKKIKKVREEFEKLRDALGFLTTGAHPIEVEFKAVIPETFDVFEDWIGKLDDKIDRLRETAGLLADAWGPVGDSIGRATVYLAEYASAQQKADQQHREAVAAARGNAEQTSRAEAAYARQSAELQIGLYGDLASAAKGFFERGTAGYKALHGAEQAFRAVQFALSVRAMAQDIAETGSKLATSAARTAAGAVEAVVNAIKSLPFPLNIAAGAATIGALAGIGVSVAGSFGGGKNTLAPTNNGSGTTLGDNSAQSKSLERAIDRLSDIDKITMQHSADMLASLRAIERNIGGFAALLVRTGNINASAGVDTGFKTDATGKVLGTLFQGAGLLKEIPVIGDLFAGLSGLVKSLFGSKTSVIASGLLGGPQAIADVLNAGFDASYFSDIKKTKKFLGLSAGSSYKTQTTDASDEIEQQFGLILKGFYDAIGAAAGPLGQSLDTVEGRLDSFVVNIGKIDLKDLTGEEIQEKLTAVFGAAADDMARAAIPGLERFQQVGEGMFETLVRVSSTVEEVTVSLGRLGMNAQGLGVDTSMALAGMFDSVGDLSQAADAYFSTYFTAAEQAASQTARLGDAFAHMGLAMPDSIAGFRALVEAQNLSTDAGRSTYATLLQLAPAFAELNGSIDGVAQTSTSAADILRERQDLERELLEVQGDTAVLRALDLAALDASNRGLQEHIWALRDQQAATEAATQAAEAAARAAEQAAAAEQARLDALASQRAGLEGEILSLLGDTAEIRRRELEALDPSLRALKERVYALTDEAAAIAAAAQAAEQQRQAEEALASQRQGLERQILELQGDTATIRAQELAALDPTLRALQLRIYALNDEAAATAAAAQAAAEAAAKQAAIANERQGLERQLLQLQGDTNALRELELAGLDATNRELQNQIYALQDAQAAAQKADQLRQAWQAVGDTIADEVKRIRGLTDTGTGGGFASLLGQFNAANTAARAGDQDAAKSLPGLSKSLLDAAAEAATSRQELARIQASTAAALEQTYGLITSATMASQQVTAALTGGAAPSNDNSWWQTFANGQRPAPSADGDARGELAQLRAELADTKEELVNVLSQLAEHMSVTAGVLRRAEKQGEGDGLAVSTVARAA